MRDAQSDRPAGQTAAAPQERGGQGRWWADYRWVVLLALGVLAWLLAMTGFRQLFNAVSPGRSWIDVAYAALQLFVLEGELPEGPVPWTLDVARFLAPAVVGYSALAALALVFQDRLHMFRVGAFRKPVVVVGLGRKGTLYAEDFLRQGREVIAVEADAGADEIPRLRRQRGALVVCGDARDAVTLRKARIPDASDVLVVTGNDRLNIQVASAARRLMKDPQARCLCHVANPALNIALEHNLVLTQEPGAPQVTVFSTLEHAARHLLLHVPLERGVVSAGDPRTVHLIIGGFGWLGQAIAVRAASMGHYRNLKPIRITAIDLQSAAHRDRFAESYPMMVAKTSPRICDFQYLQREASGPGMAHTVDELLAVPDQLSTVVLCLGDDILTLAVFQRLKASIEKFGAQAVLCLTNTPVAGAGGSEGARGLARAGDVWLLGLFDATCCVDAVSDNRLDWLARANHEDYRNQKRKEALDKGEEFRETGSLAPWERLAESLKESNRQLADHIDIKLRAVGARRRKLAPDEPPPPFVFSPQEVEELARAEHNRWCAERWLGGWRHGDPSDKARRISNCLVEWDRLTEQVKGYDREAVTRIPVLLAGIGEGTER